MHALVNGVRLFLDVEGAQSVPDGPAMREKPTLRPVGRPEMLRWFTKPGGESQTFDLFPDLHRIRCPTLVMGGEDDPIHPIESQADIAAALPPHLVQFERFENCRHAVIPDAPDRGMAVIGNLSRDNRTLQNSSFDAFSTREPVSTSLENAMPKTKPAPEGAGD